ASARRRLRWPVGCSASRVVGALYERRKTAVPSRADFDRRYARNTGETPALPGILERRAPLLDRPPDENNQHAEGQQDQNDNRQTDSLHKRAESSRGLAPDQIPREDDRPQEQRPQRPAQRSGHAAPVRVVEDPRRAKHLDAAQHKLGLDQSPAALGEPGCQNSDQQQDGKEEPREPYVARRRLSLERLKLRGAG